MESNELVFMAPKLDFHNTVSCRSPILLTILGGPRVRTKDRRGPVWSYGSTIPAIHFEV